MGMNTISFSSGAPGAGRVVLTACAQRELNKLSRTIHYRIVHVLIRLEEWPAISGAKLLRHRLAGRFRIRTGDYRIQFYLDGKHVIVEKIGHRDGFYDD
jgi:mRNA-degrading endonuclease RelE of RelBE toxin-antitoxin system